MMETRSDKLARKTRDQLQRAAMAIKSHEADARVVAGAAEGEGAMSLHASGGLRLLCLCI